MRNRRGQWGEFSRGSNSLPTVHGAGRTPWKNGQSRSSGATHAREFVPTVSAVDASLYLARPFGLGLGLVCIFQSLPAVVGGGQLQSPMSQRDGGLYQRATEISPRSSNSRPTRHEPDTGEGELTASNSFCCYSIGDFYESVFGAVSVINLGSTGGSFVQRLRKSAAVLSDPVTSIPCASNVPSLDECLGDPTRGVHSLYTIVQVWKAGRITQNSHVSLIGKIRYFAGRN